MKSKKENLIIDLSEKLIYFKSRIKLYSLLDGDVILDSIDDSKEYPIKNDCCGRKRFESNDKYVDMGNGVLWATSNITRTADGSYKLADNPWDYGCYFSWGDVVGHNSTDYNDGYSFSEDNYSRGLSGSGYNLTEDIPSGDPTYDAATATLGENWRMPTYDEYKWLVDNCNPTWTTLNGVNGELFTNPNNSFKTLFFPAAGIYNYTNVNCSSSSNHDAITGFYLSSRIDHLYFSDSSNCRMHNGPLHLGLSVRPVMNIK